MCIRDSPTTTTTTSPSKPLVVKDRSPSTTASNERVVTESATKVPAENEQGSYYNDHEKTLVWVTVCVVILILATLVFVGVMCFLRYRRASKDRRDRHEVFQLFDSSPENGGARLDRVNRKQQRENKPIVAGNGYDVPYVDERSIQY